VASPVSFPVPAGISKSGASPLAAIARTLSAKPLSGRSHDPGRLQWRCGSGRLSRSVQVLTTRRAVRSGVAAEAVLEHGVNIVAVTDPGVPGMPVTPTSAAFSRAMRMNVRLLSSQARTASSMLGRTCGDDGPTLRMPNDVGEFEPGADRAVMRVVPRCSGASLAQENRSDHRTPPSNLVASLKPWLSWLPP
jgi:hypothetical protein